jgi:hypothetical protein
MQEAYWLLSGEELRGSTRQIVKLGLGYPDNRVRVVDSRAFRAANQQPDVEDGDEVVLKTNTYTYYRWVPTTNIPLHTMSHACTTMNTVNPITNLFKTHAAETVLGLLQHINIGQQIAQDLTTSPYLNS